MTQKEDAKAAQKIYEDGIAGLLDQYEEMLVEEENFLVFAKLINPIWDTSKYN